MCGEAFLFNLQGAELIKCLFGMRRGIGKRDGMDRWMYERRWGA
jgi:hypothetical protein